MSTSTTTALTKFYNSVTKLVYD